MEVVRFGPDERVGLLHGTQVFDIMGYIRDLHHLTTYAISAQ
jgi:hypothetical protein